LGDGVQREQLICDSFLSQFVADPTVEPPFPLYAALRRMPPSYVQCHNVWLVARYDDCVTILKDPTSFAYWEAKEEFQDQLSGAVAAGNERPCRKGCATISGESGDVAHTERQIMFYKALDLVRRLKDLDPQILPLANQLIDGFAQDMGVEVISRFAVPMVVTLISRLFGFPSSEWTRLINAWLEYLTPPTTDSSGRSKCNMISELESASRAFRLHIASEVENRHSGTHDDVVTAALVTPTDGQRLEVVDVLSFAEAVARNAVLTTTDFIGNALSCFANQKNLCRKLSENPSLVPLALEEVLRLESPVQILRRRAVRDVRLGTTALARGARLLVIIGAANRDDSVFPNPDCFELQRHNVREHLAFGYGMNVCLAAMMARRIASVAVETILRRLNNLRLMPGRELKRRHAKGNRGIYSLWLAFDG
jgi:cytochrome P450